MQMQISDAINLIMLGKANGSVFYIVCGISLLAITSLASLAVKTYWRKRKLKKKAEVEKQEITSKANELVSVMVDAIKTSSSTDIIQQEKA